MPSPEIRRNPQNLGQHLKESLRRLWDPVRRWLRRLRRSWMHLRRQKDMPAYARDSDRSLQEIQMLENWAYTQVLAGEAKEAGEVLQILCRTHSDKANQPAIEQVGWFEVLADWANIWSKTVLTAHAGPDYLSAPGAQTTSDSTLEMLQEHPETWEHLFRTLVVARQHLQYHQFNIHRSVLLMASQQPGVREDPRLKRLLIGAGGVGVLATLCQHSQGREFAGLLLQLSRQGAGGQELAAELLARARPEQLRGLQQQDLQQLLQTRCDPLRQAALRSLGQRQWEQQTTVH